MTVSEYRFEDRETMMDAVYQVVLSDLDEALRQRAAATLLLSGGSTPAPLYRRLARAELDWPGIDVALVDERWVDAEDAASNERLVRETLLHGAAAGARFTGMKNNHPTPFSGEAECNLAYAKLKTPFDLCLLGMGPDGHTASLFPGADGLEDALNKKLLCAAIRARRSEVTGDNLERMTMTPWGLRQSRRLILLISGEQKWRIYEEARQSGASAQLPVSWLIDQSAAPLDVYWCP